MKIIPVMKFGGHARIFLQFKLKIQPNLKVNPVPLAGEKIQLVLANVSFVAQNFFDHLP